MGTEKEGDIVGQANKGVGEPKIRGSRCSCAEISLRALETLRWKMWTEGSTEVYPALSKTAGRLVEQASRRKSNTILSQMSILHTCVSSERQMLSSGGAPYEAHIEGWRVREFKGAAHAETGNVEVSRKVFCVLGNTVIKALLSRMTTRERGTMNHSHIHDNSATITTIDITALLLNSRICIITVWGSINLKSQC